MSCVHLGDTIITFDDEVEKDPSWDLRTKKGREAEVLEQVRMYKGFTVFWATENQKRAHAICRLEGKKKIRRLLSHPRAHFPWCVYIIRGKKK